ncbi:MAG: PEP-CTERM sorting domain-containing protein [Phycisphaerales bacterium]|nr:PEP-CTERM sorting domain-containing protein [Phycisphaerales bacterium]
MPKQARAYLGIAALLAALAASQSNADMVLVDNITQHVSTSYFTSAGYGAGVNGIVNESALQEFEAPFSGQVTSIATIMFKFSPAETEPLRISLHTAVNNVPGTQLGEIIVPANSIPYPDDTELTFDFTSANANVIAGERYLVAFHVANPVVSLARYGFPHVWSVSSNLGYGSVSGQDGLNGGYLLPFPDDEPSVFGELALRIHAIPEPTTGTLMIIVAIGAISGRRKSR